MALFSYKGKKVVKFLPTKIKLERDIQVLIENNLEEILDITFLAHEYPTSFGGRMDTLGIDKSGAPCIIEYKRGRNDNVINQGLSYLRWLLDHKANFETLCRERSVNINIDWSSPRVICVAESFNKFDMDTVDLLPIKIELLRYKLYGDNILQIEAEKYQNITLDNTFIAKSEKKKDVHLETLQKKYTLNDHLKNASPKIQEVFEELREQILSLDKDITEEPKKLYIAYKLSTNFTDIVIAKNKIRVYVNLQSGELHDPRKLARDLENPRQIGHWGNGDYDIHVADVDQLDYVMTLIKQGYERNR